MARIFAIQKSPAGIAEDLLSNGTFVLICNEKRLFVNSWGKKVKMKSIIKQLQSSDCLIFVKILMREDM